MAMLAYTEEPPLPARSSVEPVGGRLKRGVDVAIASIVLVAICPLLLLIAGLLKVTGRGPVLYGHMRVGLGGRLFKCWKFRTMAVEADALLADLLMRDSLAREEWEKHRKLKIDPRVTAVGAVLRRMSLDELPQLWNVLRGDMSLVGPRPIVPAELHFYGEDAAYYMAARPGLTGEWQISGRNDLDYATRVALDRSYVANWTMAQDILILVKTPRVMFSAEGAY